jgi:transposase
MRLIRWGWNLAVRRERWARQMISLGRAADLHNYLAHRDLNPTGRRGAKRKTMTDDQLRQEQAARAWSRKRSGLSVEYACAAVDDAKQSRVLSALGSAWAKLTSDKGKFQRAWDDCWKGLRKAPRKNKKYAHGWLSRQIQNTNPIVNHLPDDRGDNYVHLGSFMPWLDASQARVRFLQHRPLPDEANITELKVTRHRRSWHVVFTVANEVPKDYPATGRSCGIDPGMRTPVTVAGDDMQAGVDGLDRGPGRPLKKATKKLRRLQRKLDRQRRANNPECYRPDGSWIKGRRMTHISHGMRETEDRIARMHARCADIRKDTWSNVADEILQRYDTVYLGKWTDGTPAAKAAAKAKRKEAWERRQEKRKKGQAAQQRTRERTNRDNALGVFRQILKEKAERSATPKQIIVINEAHTTQSCCACSAREGPAGQAELKIRDWTCPQCRHQQKRDRGAAWNILQAGLRQAGGQPVTEGRVVPLVAESVRADGPALGIKRTSASSQVGAFPGEALASTSTIVPRHRVTNARARKRERGTGQQQRLGPQPLAEGTASTTNHSP